MDFNHFVLLLVDWSLKTWEILRLCGVTVICFGLTSQFLCKRGQRRAWSCFLYDVKFVNEFCCLANPFHAWNDLQLWELWEIIKHTCSSSGQCFVASNICFLLCLLVLNVFLAHLIWYNKMFFGFLALLTSFGTWPYFWISWS